VTEVLADIWREYRADNVAPGSRVVDLGSSEGHFSRWAESMGATVDAYDVRYGTAVGPYDGTCSVVGDGLGASIVPGDGDTPMVSLATVLAKHRRVDFLKCDIEGGEYLIFDDCDLSNVARFGIEFHAWTTPADPVDGLGVKDEPMPPGAFDRLVAQLERTHMIEVVGPPEAGGYIYGALRAEGLL
jgi:hypothetical protein